MEFTEKQSLVRTKASLLVVLPLLAPGILYISVLSQNAVLTSLIVSVIICVVSWFFLKTIQLILHVNESCISFQIKGLQRKEEVVLWEDIKQIEKTSIKPLSQFGGWGLRFSRSRTGYIFEGEDGVELTTVRNNIFVITIRDTESFFTTISFFQARLNK